MVASLLKRLLHCSVLLRGLGEGLQAGVLWGCKVDFNRVFIQS